MSLLIKRVFFVNLKTKRFCFYSIERAGFKYEFTSYDKRPLSEVGMIDFSWYTKTEFSTKDLELINEKVDRYVNLVTKNNYELTNYSDLIELGLGIDYSAASVDTKVIERITKGIFYVDEHYYEHAVVYANRVEIVTGYMNAFWVSSSDLRKRLETELDSEDNQIGIYNLSLKTVFIKKQSYLKKVIEVAMRERDVDVPVGVQEVLEGAIDQYHQQQADDIRFFDLLNQSDYQFKKAIYEDFCEYRLCIHEGDLTIDIDVLIHSNRHRRFPQYQEIVLITGNLTINGTLLINENPDEQLKGKLIVLGEVKVRNFIDNSDSYLHLEYGKLTVDQLVYIKLPMLRCEGMKVNCPLVLTDEHRDNFSEIKSTMPLALLRDDIKLIDGIVNDNDIIDVGFLSKTVVAGRSIFVEGFDVQASFTGLLQEEKELELPRRIEKFINQLRSPHYYPEAFCSAEYIDVEDDDIIGGKLYPNGGDAVYYDHRCHDGFIGLSHDGGDSGYIKLKKKKLDELNIERKPSIQRTISSFELIQRYEYFGYLFSDWAGSDSVSLGFNTEADLQSAYLAEADSLHEDEHLALYWALVFSILTDEINFSNVEQKLKNSQSILVQSGIAFCQSLDLLTDIDLGNDVPSDMFRRRRAYLLWNVYSYQTENDSLARWWDSYLIYPLRELYLVRRVRWLKVNLDKFNRWSEFNELSKDHGIDTASLFSYLICCNPETENAAKALAAYDFVQEVNEHFEIWNDPISKGFVISMLFDIHTYLDDRELLAATIERYIDGCDRNQERDKKYHTMLAFVTSREDGGTDKQFAESVKAADQMHMLRALDGMGDFTPQTSPQEFLKVYQLAEPYLSNYTASMIAELIKRVERANCDRNLLQIILVFLYRNPELENRQTLALDVWQRLSLSDHDIMRMFSEFPKLISGGNDPNLGLIQSFITESVYDEFQNPASAAVMFLLQSISDSAVFKFIIDVLTNFNHQGAHEAIFSKLFNREYESSINPSLSLNKDQMNIALDTTWDYLPRHDYINAPHASCILEAVSVFYDCENKYAKEWFEQKLSDEQGLRIFFSFEGASHIRSDTIEALRAGLSRMK